MSPLITITRNVFSTLFPPPLISYPTVSPPILSIDLFCAIYLCTQFFFCKSRLLFVFLSIYFARSPSSSLVVLTFSKPSYIIILSQVSLPGRDRIMYNFNFSFVRSGAPIVTFSVTGLAFNPIVCSMLGCPDSIDIGYDEDANVLGVCAHRQEHEGKPYEFASRKKDGWVRISCRDFMRYLSQRNNMDFTKAKQFIPEFDSETQMLIIHIDEEHIKPAKATKESE